MNLRLQFSLATFLLLAISLHARAADENAPQPEMATYQVLGLFSPDRVADLREAATALSEITLISVDYDNAQATFSFDRLKLFKNVKPDEIMKRIDNQLRTATKGTFSLKQRCVTPREELTRIEIGVVGLDCKGCCLGAYESVAKLAGVEIATVSFKEGRLIAYVDSKLVDRATLEAALKKRNIPVIAAEPAPKPAESTSK